MCCLALYFRLSRTSTIAPASGGCVEERGSSLTEMRVFQATAHAFHAEGVRTIFGLSGDGNMHWEAALAQLPDVRSYHVRHEHTACAMASAYAVASGDVGVASVTCGPGL